MTRPERALAPAAAIVVAVCFAVQPTAEAQRPAAAARVIDRTLLCSTLTIGGGLYQLDVRAQEGVRESRTTWKSLAFAAARSGHIARGPAELDASLAWAGAGRASHETNLEGTRSNSTFPAQVHGTLALNQNLCRRSTARVRLTARGLDGGPAGQLGEEYECRAPRQVLVRVRATLRMPAPFYQERHFLKTKATLESAYLAIRTRGGRRLAFAAVFGSGRARLYTAARCLAD